MRKQIATCLHMHGIKKLYTFETSQGEIKRTNMLALACIPKYTFETTQEKNQTTFDTSQGTLACTPKYTFETSQGKNQTTFDTNQGKIKRTNMLALACTPKHLHNSPHMHAWTLGDNIYTNLHHSVICDHNLISFAFHQLL